jgi:hypothetical protein
MKTINVSPRAKALNALLKAARGQSLILRSTEGERFVLTSIGDWQGFDVGESDDFAEEVTRTARNAELMTVLAERKRANGSQRSSIEEIKRDLDIS